GERARRDLPCGLVDLVDPAILNIHQVAERWDIVKPAAFGALNQSSRLVGGNLKWMRATAGKLDHVRSARLYADDRSPARTKALVIARTQLLRIPPAVREAKGSDHASVVDPRGDAYFDQRSCCTGYKQSRRA